MNKPGDNRFGHVVICKDAAPCGGFQVGCKEKAFTFMDVGYYTKLELGTVTVDRDITPLIEDQQIPPDPFSYRNKGSTSFSDSAR